MDMHTTLAGRIGYKEEALKAIKSRPQCRHLATLLEVRLDLV